MLLPLATRGAACYNPGRRPHALRRDLAMLIISRRRNESIVINDDVIIHVVEVRGDRVRLAIQAPRECPVHRGEVQAAIEANQQPTCLGRPDPYTLDLLLPSAETSLRALDERLAQGGRVRFTQEGTFEVE